MLRSDSLPISLFCRCPFLAYSQSTWLKDIFVENCLKQDLQPNIVMITSNYMSRSAMCLSGLGIMFIATSFLNEEINKNGSKYKEQHNAYSFVINDENFSKEIAISYLKQHHPSSANKNFIQIAEETLKSIDVKPTPGTLSGNRI